VNSSLEYFGTISSLGPSALALTSVLAADIAFTGVHIWQEWRGEKFPLYRAFGAIVGLWFPRWAGFLLFTVILAVVQWAIGIVAYASYLPFPGMLPTAVGVCALGAVLGARLGDSIISHWVVSLVSYRPNPGLSSTALYTLEAVLIFICFRGGLALDPIAAWKGFALGFLLFLSVIPILAVLRAVIEPWQRERWVRGEQVPDWVYA